MCNKKINEDISHNFVGCKYAKETFEYIKNDLLSNKTLNNSLDLLEFKRNVTGEDYRILSNFVYSMWRVRNSCKHNKRNDNPFELFKAYFNKWIISMSNI